MQTLDQFFNELQSQLTVKNLQAIQSLGQSPLMEEHELAQTFFALLSQRSYLKPYKPHLSPLASGAVPLFGKCFFPWKGLPYPEEHAKLGALLLQLDDEKMKKIAHHMAFYQEATLDHYKKPLVSFFLQEGVETTTLEVSNTLFFDAVNITPADVFQFTDHDLGIISRRNAATTVLCSASGCKSGMGVYLYKDAGIINYGPQLLPLGECSGFGLAGRAHDIHIYEDSSRFSLSYCCRLAAPSSRKTGFSRLEDSGASMLRMKAEIGGTLSEISLRTLLEGLTPLNQRAFSFFGKGSLCVVAGSHQLKPRSLDRYYGPANPLCFLCGKEGVRIDVVEGIAHMEVIPLAGEKSFWGADFLVAYTFKTPEAAFVLSLKKND